MDLGWIQFASLLLAWCDSVQFLSSVSVRSSLYYEVVERGHEKSRGKDPRADNPNPEPLALPLTLTVKNPKPNASPDGKNPNPSRANPNPIRSNPNPSPVAAKKTLSLTVKTLTLTVEAPTGTALMGMFGV